MKLQTFPVCVVGALVAEGVGFPELVFGQSTAEFNCTCAQRPLLSQYCHCWAC